MTRNLTLNFEGDRVVWTGCNKTCALIESGELEPYITPFVQKGDAYCLPLDLASGYLYFCTHPDAIRFTDGTLKLCMVRASRMSDNDVEAVNKGKIRSKK